jgi:hypothetical protein
MMVGNFHHDPASHDLVIIFIQVLCLLADVLPESLWKIKITGSNLQWKSHIIPPSNIVNINASILTISKAQVNM